MISPIFLFAKTNSATDYLNEEQKFIVSEIEKALLEDPPQYTGVWNWLKNNFIFLESQLWKTSEGIELLAKIRDLSRASGQLQNKDFFSYFANQINTASTRHEEFNQFKNEYFSILDSFKSPISQMSDEKLSQSEKDLKVLTDTRVQKKLKELNDTQNLMKAVANLLSSSELDTPSDTEKLSPERRLELENKLSRLYKTNKDLESELANIKQRVLNEIEIQDIKSKKKIPLDPAQAQKERRELMLKQLRRHYDAAMREFVWRFGPKNLEFETTRGQAFPIKTKNQLSLLTFEYNPISSDDYIYQNNILNQGALGRTNEVNGFNVFHHDASAHASEFSYGQNINLIDPEIADKVWLQQHLDAIRQSIKTINNPKSDLEAHAKYNKLNYEIFPRQLCQDMSDLIAKRSKMFFNSHKLDPETLQLAHFIFFKEDQIQQRDLRAQSLKKPDIASALDELIQNAYVYDKKQRFRKNTGGEDKWTNIFKAEESESAYISDFNESKEGTSTHSYLNVLNEDKNQKIPDKFYLSPWDADDLNSHKDWTSNNQTSVDQKKGILRIESKERQDSRNRYHSATTIERVPNYHSDIIRIPMPLGYELDKLVLYPMEESYEIYYQNNHFRKKEPLVLGKDYIIKVNPDQASAFIEFKQRQASGTLFLPQYQVKKRTNMPKVNPLTSLDKKPLLELEKIWREAGFVNFADALNDLIKSEKIYLADFDDLMRRNSEYAWKAEKVKRVDDPKAISDLTPFLNEKGVFCTQCTGMEEFTRISYGIALGDNTDYRMQRRTVIKTKHNPAFGKEEESFSLGTQLHSLSTLSDKNGAITNIVDNTPASPIERNSSSGLFSNPFRSNPMSDSSEFGLRTESKNLNSTRKRDAQFQHTNQKESRASELAKNSSRNTDTSAPLNSNYPSDNAIGDNISSHATNSENQSKNKLRKWIDLFKKKLNIKLKKSITQFKVDDNGGIFSDKNISNSKAQNIHQTPQEIETSHTNEINNKDSLPDINKRKLFEEALEDSKRNRESYLDRLKSNIEKLETSLKVKDPKARTLSSSEEKFLSKNKFRELMSPHLRTARPSEPVSRIYTLSKTIQKFLEGNLEWKELKMDLDNRFGIKINHLGELTQAISQEAKRVTKTLESVTKDPKFKNRIPFYNDENFLDSVKALSTRLENIAGTLDIKALMWGQSQHKGTLPASKDSMPLKTWQRKYFIRNSENCETLLKNLAAPL